MVARGRVQLPTFALGVRCNAFDLLRPSAFKCIYNPCKNNTLWQSLSFDDWQRIARDTVNKYPQSIPEGLRWVSRIT